ncbi:MAG: AAA family ATPase [Sulfuricellaceae bacterium]
MRILAIRGKNLASLAGEFEIDFQREPLLSAGLYAISGPTGAGKSTLLDALCLALFDDTPRLKSADARGIELPDVGAETTLPNDRRNILRRGTAEGYAEVDFLGNDGVGYRARWSVRRAGLKMGGRLQKIEMSLLRLDDLQPVGGHLKSEVVKTIAEKIGLSFEQFTRAVLLAQNEFFTFLKAGDDERAALLQTLTGTDRFETLSRRAFERHKSEQEKLRQLRARLDDQQPLSAEERSRYEDEQLAAKSAIQAQGEQEKRLAGHLRWHQELEKALKRESDALIELEKADALRAEAAPRRARFERVEAVQGARPLLAEAQRIEKACADSAGQASAAQDAAALSAQACAGAQSAWESADAALNHLESANRQFAPLIAQARALDIDVATRRTAHVGADKAFNNALAALAQAQSECDANRQAIQAAQAQLQAAQVWLAEHRHLQPLAEGWMRWDTLFTGAGEEQRRIVQVDEELQVLGKQGQQQIRAVEDGETRLAAAAAALQAAEIGLRDAVAALAFFDAEAPARAKAGLDSRKDALQNADKVWRERSAGEAQLAALASETEALASMREQSRQRWDEVRAQLPVVQATAQQAERAWRVVFDAAQENVGALRAQLQADAPCPVCGALAHPYVTHNPTLDNALARLEDALARCRQTVKELEIEEKTQLNQLENLGGRIGQIRLQHDQIVRKQESILAAWSQAVSNLTALFGADYLCADAALFPTWLANQLARIQDETQRVAEQETQLRLATANRQKAQERLDAARKAHDALKDESARLKAGAERTQAALQSVRDHRDGVAQRQADALDQLDQAHPGDNTWRAQWATNPQKYHAARQRDADAWAARKKSEEIWLTDMTGLEAAARGLSRLAAEAEVVHRQAGLALTQIGGQLQALLAARRNVFAGMALPEQPAGVALEDMAVQQIDNHLAGVIAAARRRQVDARHTFQENEQRLAVQQERLAQLAQLLAAHQAEGQQATARLAHWLAEFNAQAPADAPLDGASLHGLLAHDAAWRAAERQALAQLDSAVTAATGGLAQLRRQRADHESVRPTEDAPETVQANLEQAAATLNGLHENLSGIELALRRDDEIKQKAAKLLNILAAQEKTARLWAQMNELIGAADGKKFRNYAQQLTLDILLGYANAHLKELARRYRLSRVKDSLALLVIDQDMGDERRSVHSLSGGESFLVSLSLALGLASLSSHRVRVESLFIDEGFGSLDAETLRVAMDALDSLQAMGRKVGVISHVQEMTERIGACVQVKRLAGGQSQVVVAGGI